MKRYIVLFVALLMAFSAVASAESHVVERYSLEMELPEGIAFLEEEYDSSFQMLMVAFGDGGLDDSNTVYAINMMDPHALAELAKDLDKASPMALMASLQMQSAAEDDEMGMVADEAYEEEIFVTRSADGMYYGKTVPVGEHIVSFMIVTREVPITPEQEADFEAFVASAKPVKID